MKSQKFKVLEIHAFSQTMYFIIQDTPKSSDRTQEDNPLHLFPASTFTSMPEELYNSHSSLEQLLLGNLNYRLYVGCGNCKMQKIIFISRSTKK